MDMVVNSLSPGGVSSGPIPIPVVLTVGSIVYVVVVCKSESRKV